jgi:hypothetical protein
LATRMLDDIAHLSWNADRYAWEAKAAKLMKHHAGFIRPVRNHPTARVA